MSNQLVSETVERVLKPIQQFTRGWMMTAPTAARGVELGLASGEEFWIAGRAGALGDCPADVAASGLAFIAPDAVAKVWAGLPAGLGPARIGEAYAACCTDWGVANLARFDPARMTRLDLLGRMVADAAAPALGALFAGWRAVPQPADVGGRVSLTMHVLREMRGAAHIIAIQACGLSPLDAILASPAPAPRSGAPWAEHLHWSGPFRDPEEVKVQRLDAETVTSKIMARHFGVLSEGELAEFAELAETTRNSIDM